MRLATVLKLAALGALILVVSLVQVVKSIDATAYRDVLAEAAKRATGREVMIRGKISLKMSLSPTLVAADVEMSNTPWGSRPSMATVQRVDAEISLLPLLLREVRITRLVLTGTNILLERDRQGRNNWSFGRNFELPPATFVAGGTATELRVSEVRFDNLDLLYKDDSSGRIQNLHLDRLVAQADNPSAPVGVSLAGTWNGRHVDVSGVLGVFRDMTAGKPVPVKLKGVLPKLVATVNGTVSPAADGPLMDLAVTAEAADLADTARLAGFTLPPVGAARLVMSVRGTPEAPQLSGIDLLLGRHDAMAISVRGAVRNPLTLQGIDLVLSLDGDNLAGFNKPLELNLPSIAPVRLSGHLADSADGWQISEVKGVLGHSDLAGELSLRWEAGRPTVRATLSSASIDLAELSGAKAPPGAARPAEGRLFSDDALPLGWLKVADGEMKWQIDHVVDDGLTADRVALAAQLQNGRLTLSPTVGAVASGSLAGQLTVDAAANPPAVTLSANADKVVLGDLLHGLNLTGGVRGGQADLRLKLQGRGGSWRMLMGRLSGESALVIGKTTFDSASPNLAPLEVINHLAAWRQQGSADMQCLVSRFVVTDGMMRSEGLVFDGSEMSVAGQGSVNLANEEIDLTLVPKPKDSSYLSQAVPLDIGGSLTQPSLSANKGTIVKAGGGPIATGLLAPLLAATGADGGDDNPCVAAFSGVPKKAPAPKKASLAAPRYKRLAEGPAGPVDNR